MSSVFSRRLGSVFKGYVYDLGYMSMYTNLESCTYPLKMDPETDSKRRKNTEDVDKSEKNTPKVNKNIK